MKHTTPSRRTVLFLLPSLGGGGAERVVTIILQHLDRSRFEPHLALLQKAGPFLEDLPKDVLLHDLKSSRVRAGVVGVIRLVRNLRPNVVFSTLTELNLMLILAKAFFPPGVKLFVREGTVVSARLAQDVRHPRMMSWLFRRLCRKADKTVCQSDYMLNDLARNLAVPREKLVRIYNPVDIERVRALATAQADPYEGRGPHLVTAGRLSKVKGYDMLLEAFARVLQKRPHADLTIVGEGPLEASLRAQRDQMNLSEVVHFAGFRANPFPYLKYADLFVLSSRYEGLPNVVLEALALGTPVVATDCPGGVREMLEGCSMGWLVPGFDSVPFAEAILSACSWKEKRPDPGTSLEPMLDRFRVERVVREYGELFSG